MHPELEHAINTGLSIPEVIKIFTKHHSAPVEERIDRHPASLARNKDHSDCSFWETWQPLFRRLHLPSVPSGMLADDPFLNIHKDLTREVISWLCDSQRKSNVYVIAEPPTPKIYASGGSRQRNYYTWANSRASVFATICSGAHRFGDEQARHWDTISTLAAGLAAYYPPFRLILTKKLVDNPGILDLPARTRFKKLVHEPWKVLRESHPHYIATPPVVVLRCNFEEIEEVFHSFCESGLSPRSSPLLWIISIDTDFIPPPLDPLDSFQYIRLPVRYNDGPSDTALILHHRFSTLRQKYEKMFDRDEVWPSEEQMSHLIRLFSGVFESIDAVINFVDSRDGGGPRVHLETFLTYMADSPSPSDERPYCALDHFYTAAYSNIPFDLLSISQDVLSIMHFAYYGPITSLQLACLLSIKEITILRVFTCLSRWAMFRVGEIYETLELFRCFREDPTRSGHFHNSRSDIFALQAFQLFLGHSFNLIEILNPRVQSTQVNAKAYSELDMVRCWATNFFYPQGTASNSSRPDSEYFLTRHFDFRCLAYACDQIYPISFCFFLRELHAWDRTNSPNIVRIEPVCSLDRQLIDSCEGLAEPLDLEGRGWSPSPKYVLLGIETETVLVLLHDSEENEKDGFPKVNIYTSAMLDFM